MKPSDENNSFNRLARRSKRLPLRVPIQVYGRTLQNQPFRDQTQTLSVDVHGARLLVNAEVQEGQTVLLVNSFTQEERECRIVHVGPKHQGRTRIGVEFTRHAPEDFWHVYNARVAMRTEKPQAEEHPSFATTLP
ncbi:MAG: PilZ domain-containing protein [Candidatus Acidiferrales bacterium]